HRQRQHRQSHADDRGEGRALDCRRRLSFNPHSERGSKTMQQGSFRPPDGAPQPSSIFSVENGVIHAYPTQAAGSAQPNAYLETEAEYSNYVIHLEYQWGEKKFAPRLDVVRDAGLIYHVHRERPADWPAGAEAQIQEGDVGDSWAVSSQLASFVDPKTGKYALPENGG